MRLAIPKIRPAVISNDLFGALDELRRFRHFNRYYYDLEFDWQKVKFASEKFLLIASKIETEFRNFQKFCNALIESKQEES
ncbi:MAG: hypothetical protein N2035_04005 [Chthoniobacterales bacterium]|nr:hypothetical protein [Chthoniobacterales bacterium]